MRHFDGANGKSRVDLYQVQGPQLDNIGIAMLSGEHISEPLPEAAGCLGTGKPRQTRAATKAERSEIVNAMTMIGVIVRPENAIDPVDGIFQQLLSQVGRGVHQQAFSRVALDDNRNSGAAIPGFGRIAFAPVVADTWHTSRCARSKYDQLHGTALEKSV